MPNLKTFFAQKTSLTLAEQTASWGGSIRALCHPKVASMLFLGISAGMPLLLIFSSLSLWLREAGVERSSVTYFSWAALAYSFKFVWAPLVDRLSIPCLTRALGRRRAWLLLSQLMIMLSIATMASVDPATETLAAMALAAVMLGFSAATQDIVIDAYRIESAQSDLQALMSASYIAGYRIGMLIAGAGALFLASYLGTTSENYNYLAWQLTYLTMAALMLIGVVTTLTISEPQGQGKNGSLAPEQNSLGLLLLFSLSVGGFISCFYYSNEFAQQASIQVAALISSASLAALFIELCRLLLALLCTAAIARFLIAAQLVQWIQVEKAYVAPVKDFFQRHGWLLAWVLLALVGLYRISDIVLGVIANIFYQDLGFSKNTIASAVKSFGLGMTILGGFLGGVLTMRFGIMRILFLGALLSALTNLLFVVLAHSGQDISMLYLVIAADNLSAGLASAAFIAFLSGLTNISFTAMQYAMFSSFMTLFPKILGGYSGSIVEGIGYQSFFLITALMGVPVLLLILWANRLFRIHQ